MAVVTFFVPAVCAQFFLSEKTSRGAPSVVSSPSPSTKMFCLGECVIFHFWIQMVDLRWAFWMLRGESSSSTTPACHSMPALLKLGSSI